MAPPAAPSEPGWQALVRLGLAVRWTTLLEGVSLRRHGAAVVTVGDVGAWAESLVEHELEQPMAIYELLAIPRGNGNDRESVDALERALRPLIAAERAEPAIELAKWRLVELISLVDRIATWPPDPEERFDGRPCSMWSACRELWESWNELLGRPPFFYPGGRECSCYDGRDFDEVIGEYRAWIAAERDRLRAADDATAARSASLTGA
jgi:hypothetical protein